MPKGARGRPKKVIDIPMKPKKTPAATPERGECSNSKAGPDKAEEEKQSRISAESEEDTEITAKAHDEAEIPATTKEIHAPVVRNRGMKLDYVAPTLKKGIPTACLEKEELEKEASKWKKAVVLYVIGDSPTITYLHTFLEKQLSIEHKPEIFYNNEGYFVIRFETMAERDKVLYDGPHTIANRPVIVKEWVKDFCFEKEILSEVPLWIQLPNLPLNCWSGNSLSRIGSVLGKPICAVECTTKQTRISYARMLVEVDVTQPLRYNIIVEREDGTNIEQKVYYE